MQKKDYINYIFIDHDGYLFYYNSDHFCMLHKYYAENRVFKIRDESRFIENIQNMIQLDMYNYNDYLSHHSANHSIYELEFIVKFFKEVRIRDLYEGLDI